MVSEERLIYANEALQMIKHSQTDNPYSGTLAEPAWKLAHDCAVSCIEACATIDAVEVVHGRWEPIPGNGTFERCSVCKDCYIYADWDVGEDKWYYCPNCGARMMDGDNNV